MISLFVYLEFQRKHADGTISLSQPPAKMLLVVPCPPPPHIPRHTAGRGAVHLPGSVQVHVDRPVGGDADRLGGLHVRRRDAPSPREPSSLRHPGGSKHGLWAQERNTPGSLASPSVCVVLFGCCRRLLLLLLPPWLIFHPSCSSNA